MAKGIANKLSFSEELLVIYEGKSAARDRLLMRENFLFIKYEYVFLLPKDKRKATFGNI